MKISKSGLDLIKSSEGFRGTAYLCPAGVPTIGWGFTVGVRIGDTMTLTEANERIVNEMVVYGEAVYQAVHGVCTQPEFDALCSLTWNIGIAGMKKSSVVRLHNAGDKAAAARAFGLWNKSRGKVLAGLVRRRSAEAALYLAGSTEMPQAVDVEKPMVKSTTIIAGSTAAIATATQVADSVSKLKGSVEGLGQWLMPALAVVALVAIGVVIYERYQNRDRGNA